MKRTLLLICTLLCANVLFAQDLFLAGQLWYGVTSDSSVVVYGYNSSNTPTDLVIPETVTYQGTTFNVTGIDFGAFCFYYNGDWVQSPCTTLTSVTIPNSVTSIGESAFYGCSSLTSVTCLRSNSPSLGDYVFNGTPNNKTLTIPCGCESEYTDWQNATTWASIDCIETIGSRFTIGDLTYEITSETEVKVQDCTESATSVVIPETVTYQGTTYSVTSIGNRAFYGCSSLTSIDIPNSVTSIGGYAFWDCSSLTSVTIPNSVTSIGSWAFWDCSSLTSITIPNSVTSIGYAAFENCSSLTSVTIPNSVTSIEGAFSGCSSLTSVTIPNSVTSIEGAFSGCSSLTSVTIPNSVTSIGSNAFSGCSSLTSIDIPNSVTSIGDRAFSSCSSLTSITIPNSVTSIEWYAFWYCSSLTSITCLRSNSPSLGNNVFYGTPNNKTLTIPCGCESEYTDWQNATTWASIDCIETIGSRFTIGDLTYEITSETEVSVQACTESATSVVIPETVTYQGTTYSVTSIGYAAFAYCSSLTSITIPNSVTSIGTHAFFNCSSLTSVNIPNSLTSIGYATFYECSNLSSINIPNSVSSIGDWSFGNCSSLTSIDIPNSVTSIGGSAFHSCTGLESINLSDNITSIGRNCFDSCINLTTVNIPTSLSVIDTSLFRYCTSLTSVTIPENITDIKAWAFIGCSSLTSVTIPNSVTSIGYAAFGECSSLTSVTCLANTPPSLGDDVFYNTPSNKILNVNCGLKDDYISSWTDFYSYNIHEIPIVVNATANDEAFGFVAVEGDCSSLTLTATANNCYQFVSWNDGNTENPRIVNLTSDTSFIATFEEINFNAELTATICQGQVYTENGFNVSEAGVYTQTLTSVNGCDSIVTLTLNVNPIFNTELSANICQGQVYNENGFNVSEAGVYTQALTSVNGCDSVVTLTVSVNPTFDTTINATINPGETYAEFGFNESEAGAYVQNLQTEFGCDSTITLVLSVNSSLLEAEIEEISFYPNPTKDKITFSQAIENVEVIDLTGKVIFTFTNVKTINIESLPSGAYYLRLTNEEIQSFRKFIKQ